MTIRHSPLAERFPRGMRVRMTESRDRLESIYQRSKGLGIVTGWSRGGGLKVLPDGYRLSSISGYVFSPESWEPLGEIIPREKWESPEMLLQPLPELPNDLDEGFETLKLAILRHKLSGWGEISAADVRRALDLLKQLTRD